jgi:hypothetical protein
MKRQEKIIGHLLFHPKDVVFVVVFIGFLLSGKKMLGLDSDIGRHLILGDYILSTLDIPKGNILSFTLAGLPRPPYEWMAQVLFTLAYRLLQIDGVITLAALVVALTFYLVYKRSNKLSGLPLISLLLTTLGASAASVHWLPRPHIWTFLFFAIWIEMLDRLERNERERLWAFPILMLLWVNVHGGFIFGFFAWFIYLVGNLFELALHFDLSRRNVVFKLLVAGGVSFAMTAVSPSGLEIWSPVINASSKFILANTIETQSPNFYLLQFWPFLLLVGCGLVLPGLGGKRLPASQLLLLAGTAILGFWMARNIPLFAIAAPPILAIAAQPLADHIRPLARIEVNFRNVANLARGAFWPILLMMGALTFFYYHNLQTGSRIYQFPDSPLPVKAADWLITHPIKGNMFNDINWGGYLLYRLWPEQKVFIDSQSDFYGESLAREYALTITAQGDWESVAGKYDIRWAIIPPGSGLASTLSRNPDWIIAYRDPSAVIYVKR